MRARVVPLLVLAGVLVGAAPAAEPDYPVSFIPVDELKAALDRGVEADVIDVRHQEAYVDMHIKGARSMPLPSVPTRVREIRKTGLVVFY